MSDSIIKKVSKREWEKMLHITELVYKIIDINLSQNPISKLDKNISKHIEEGANSIYKANVLIDKELNQNKDE